jgi:hypothetical protein
VDHRTILKCNFSKRHVASSKAKALVVSQLLLLIVALCKRCLDIEYG